MDISLKKIHDMNTNKYMKIYSSSEAFRKMQIKITSHILESLRKIHGHDMGSFEPSNCGHFGKLFGNFSIFLWFVINYCLVYILNIESLLKVDYGWGGRSQEPTSSRGDISK